MVVRKNEVERCGENAAMRRGTGAVRGREGSEALPVQRSMAERVLLRVRQLRHNTLRAVRPADTVRGWRLPLPLFLTLFFLTVFLLSLNPVILTG